MNAPSFVPGWASMPIPDAEYHARPEVSCHQLLDFEQSPRLYREKYITRTLKTDVTPAMTFGTLFHQAVLEPKEYMKRPVGPEAGKTTKAWLEFKAKHEDAVHFYDNYQITEMIHSISQHPDANAIISKEDAKREQVGFANFEGVNMRMKCDMVTDDFILDLKTTYDSSDKAFGYDADKYGYLFQATVYTSLAALIDGKYRKFYIMAVEKTAPYEVAIYSIPDAVLEKEFDRFKTLVKQLRFSRAENKWSFRNPHVKPIWLTNYYFERLYENL